MLQSFAPRDRAEMVNDEGGGDLRVLLVGVYRFTPHEAGVERRVGKAKRAHHLSRRA